MGFLLAVLTALAATLGLAEILALFGADAWAGPLRDAGRQVPAAAIPGATAALASAPWPRPHWYKFVLKRETEQMLGERITWPEYYEIYPREAYRQSFNDAVYFSGPGWWLLKLSHHLHNWAESIVGPEIKGTAPASKA